MSNSECFGFSLEKIHTANESKIAIRCHIGHREVETLFLDVIREAGRVSECFTDSWGEAVEMGHQWIRETEKNYQAALVAHNQKGGAL
jgi:hypothetical protein